MNETTSITRGLREVFKEIDLHLGAGALRPIATGLDGFDAATGGLHSGMLVAISGRPAHGKTAFAMTIAGAAARMGRPVLFVTGGCTVAIVMRMILAESSVLTPTLLRGQVNRDDVVRLTVAASAMAKWPFDVVDMPRMTLNALGTVCQEWRAAQGSTSESGLIVVNLAPGGVGTEDGESTSRPVSPLKRLAVDLNVTVLVTARASQRAEDRPDGRPIIEDLEGEIELAGAALIAFVHRPELSSRAVGRKGTTELIIRRNACGPVCTLEFAYADSALALARPSTEEP